jgi:flagellar hook-associated protein 3 FlgL
MGRSVISGVTYEGDSTVQNREIENSRYVDVGSPGSFSFWASNTEITSTTDASEYISQTDQKIMIDNTVIDIKEGDNLETIAERINSASAGFEASVVSQRGEGRVLKIQSREPHKLMIQDLEGGTTLQDLGILREGLANITESNYSPSAVVNGKSVFEVLMFTRDSMLKDDVANVGGSALGLLDEALGNVLDNQTKVSSKVSRLDMTDLGFSNQKYATIEALSKNEDIDFSEEILNFNMWQYAHNASLQTAGKLLGRTLMDYLR